MPAYQIHLSDDEDALCQAYLTWHQQQPVGSLNRLLPAEAVEDMESLLNELFDPWRTMLRAWWESHPELHPQETTPHA